MVNAKGNLKRPAKKPGGPQPFQTDAEVIKFANRFLRERARGFKKDVDICLTGTRNDDGRITHAYMPALMLTMSFLDLLSGLYAGSIRSQSHADFLTYMSKFAPAGRYSPDDLRLLYIGFRHKIAHLSHPYMVLDTLSDKKIGGPHRKIAWKIYASRRSVPIELVPYPSMRTIGSHATPWPVPFNHHIKISIPMLAVDARRTLNGRTGYIAALRSNVNLRSKFASCMTDFFPQ